MNYQKEIPILPIYNLEIKLALIPKNLKLKPVFSTETIKAELTENTINLRIPELKYVEVIEINLD